jgi:hypothetical protein
MAKEIDTWDKLDKFIDSKIQIALKSLGEDVVEVMREKVETHVYLSDNSAYERTGHFADSVMATDLKKVGHIHTLNVEHDTEFLSLYNDPDNFIYGSNYYKTSDISEWLPEILAENKSGNLFGTGAPWHNRTNYFEETWKEVEKGKWIEDRFVKAFGVI